MAITVSRMFSGTGFTDDWEGSRTYSERWQVISDDPNTSAVAIRAAAGLPQPGDAHPVDAAAYVKSRSASQDEKTRLRWEVDISYEYSPRDPKESPLDRDPEVEWTSQMFTKSVVKDRNGEACLNSAGDYFDPPLEAEFIRWTANIQFNVASVPVWLKQYAGAINNAPIEIDGDSTVAERARIVALSISKRQVQNDISFKTVTLSVECRDADDDSFDLEPIDQGLRIKDEETGKLVDILVEDESGTERPASAQVLLDGAGKVLANPSPATAFFHHFEVPRRLDFSVIPGIS